MAKAEHIMALARAALNHDGERSIATCKMIMASERDGSSLKWQLEKLLSTKKPLVQSVELPADVRNLLLHITPDKSLSELTFDPVTQTSISQFLDERSKREILKRFNLKPAHRIMLHGPPGNGKTSLAGALAEAMDLPFYLMDFSKVISGHLGATSNQIAKVFRAVATIPCVLFIDEMDAVLTERSGFKNREDVGEVSRIVNGLLMEIDRLPDNVVLIGATNHVEMLDSAVVRRFDSQWELGKPTREIRQAWLNNFAMQNPELPVESFQLATEELSLSDLERLTLLKCKEWVLHENR